MTVRWLLQDGLGSVRAVADNLSVLSAQAYSPYGEPLMPAIPSGFGFTGEQTDPSNALVYLRARHLNPRLGIFGSLDPFEGMESAPMSMNGYSWVEGNVINRVDPRGEFCVPFSDLYNYASQQNGTCTAVTMTQATQAANPFGRFNNDVGAAGFGEALIPAGALVGKLAAKTGGFLAWGATYVAANVAKPVIYAGLLGGAANFVEQFVELSNEFQNQNKSPVNILGQINYGEVITTGVYTAATTAMHRVTKGVSTAGAIANAAVDISTSGGDFSNGITEEIATSLFYGAILGTATKQYSELVKTLPTIQRIALSAYFFWGVGAAVYTFQNLADNWFTGTALDNEVVHKAFLYGLTSYADFFGYNILSDIFVGYQFNVLYDNHEDAWIDFINNITRDIHE